MLKQERRGGVIFPDDQVQKPMFTLEKSYRNASFTTAPAITTEPNL
jgi:hypothetical protein